MVDGTITFSTDLDNKELEKKLQSTQKRVERLEDSIAQKKAERFPLAENAKQLGAELDAAKMKLYEMQTATDSAFSPDKISDQQEIVKGLQAQWNGVQGRAERYDAAISNATIELDRQKEKAGGIQQELVNASKGGTAMGTAVESAQKSMQRFKMRLREVIRSALIFTVITQSLAKLRDWIGKVIKTNGEASTAMARLKGALLTMAQPIVEVVIPAFVFLVSVLTAVINAVSKLFSWIAGKSIDQTRKSAEALYGETDAISSAGNAAEKAKKQLAGFDEINQLSSGESGSGGSSGGASGGVTPDFSGDMSWMKDMTDQAAGWVTAGLILGGIFFIVAGICTQNIKMVIGGVLLLGAGIAFGVESGTFENWWDVLGLPEVSNWIVPALLLVGIGLIVFGILLSNVAMLLIGAGLLGAGIAIGTESGTFQSWWDVLGLPEAQKWVTAAILIGGMGMLVFGIVTQNILLMILGVVTLGIGVGFGLDNGSFQKWWEALCLPQVSGWVTDALLLGGMGLLVIGMSTGNILMIIAGLSLLGCAITFGIKSGTFKMWITSIGACLKEGWQDIKSWWNANVAPVFTSQWWNDLGRTIMNGLISGVESGINWVLGGVGDMVNGMTGILNKIPGVNIGRVNWGNVHIPRLAQGAVIPPNREFMAVLGDQHHGTNVEAPLETIQQAVAITMQPLMDAMLAFAKSGGGNIALTVNLDGRVVYENVVQRNNAIVRSTGESPLLT